MKSQKSSNLIARHPAEDHKKGLSRDDRTPLNAKYMYSYYTPLNIFYPKFLVVEIEHNKPS